MRLSHFVLLSGSISASLPGVLGWGAAGHEIVATIAQIHLHPSVYPALCDILNYTSPDPRAPPCRLAPIAAWADRLRYKMRWSSPLHYVGAVDDYPSQTCEFPGSGGWAGERRRNVLGAVRNVTDILEDYADGGGSVGYATANEAAKFLVHFMGDLHMPLHLTGRDRGGNDDKVRFGGRITNLHALWDGLLIAKAIRETPSNYSVPLASPQIEWVLRGAIYDSYVRRIMWEGVLDQWKDEIPSWVACPAPARAYGGGGLWQTVMRVFGRDVAGETDDEVLCPYHWAAPIHALNCEIVWPKALDEPPYKNTSRIGEYAPRGGPYLELDTPEYAGVIKERLIVEKLLAQAGIRLAAVLNWLFAETDGLNVVEI
ncbi:hypothetical protein D9615_006179 [Tricholomella constricta]|uniref:Phospholipase C/P1 nuclease n=1 Tax=Tricholomella constricta TaxID=117010 RepID=A0A8H5HBD0_9AGAR|nr:hypothetical protein D9615_006179 [Tricholomella constricta]